MSVKDYYFCAAKERPDCLKSTNSCCRHCDEIKKCMSLNKKSVQPCTEKVIDLEDKCEFSL